MKDPLAPAVLVVVEPQRLLARVALRRRMILVTANSFEGFAVCPEADLDATVALAQDAGCLQPGTIRCFGSGFPSCAGVFSKCCHRSLPRCRCRCSCRQWLVVYDGEQVEQLFEPGDVVLERRAHRCDP